MTDKGNNIYSALLAFQKEIKPIIKDGENPHFGSRYATLDAILEAIKPLLSKHGLLLLQSVEPDPDMAKVKTVIAHVEDGRTVESTVALRPVKPDPQGMGSAITYCRRYGVATILGLANEEDDDANTASQLPAKTFAKQNKIKEDDL